MKGILTAAAAALMLVGATAADAQAPRGGVDSSITSLRAKQGAKGAGKSVAARVTTNAGKERPAAPTVVPRVRTSAPDTAATTSRATTRAVPAAPGHAERPGRKKG